MTGESDVRNNTIWTRSCRPARPLGVYGISLARDATHYRAGSGRYTMADHRCLGMHVNRNSTETSCGI